MAIDEYEKVDGLGIDPSNGEVNLFISDHLNWDDDSGHFQHLERKISSYIDFIKSGQLMESLPEAKDKPIRIILFHEHCPTDPALEILDSISTQLSSYGVCFSHSELPSGY